MALVDYRNTEPQAFTSVANGFRADKTAATLPESTTQNIFTVAGGRVLVNMLFGEVTTVVQAQACNLKVTCAPTTGTAVDIASNVDINAKEARGLFMVEGDGTALVSTTAGAAYSAVGFNPFVVAEGVIRIATSATNTGATKWSCYWVPLDEGATVVTA